MRKVLVLSASLVFYSSLAVAGEPDYSLKFHQCMDKAAGETAGMLECISEETKAQDAKLNAAYKADLSRLDQSRAKQLQEAQRTWIKFRDANCQFYADPSGGTNAAVAADDCVLLTTAIRAKELEILNRQDVESTGNADTESVKSGIDFNAIALAMYSTYMNFGNGVAAISAEENKCWNAANKNQSVASACTVSAFTGALIEAAYAREQGRSPAPVYLGENIRARIFSNYQKNGLSHEQADSSIKFAIDNVDKALAGLMNAGMH